ncbi:hypothetical protein LTR33_003456 [Friedmanniomyces endolithicus]|nr:hypothetical protein LTR33_003456 [Friedmanniomyces endolithicus]
MPSLTASPMPSPPPDLTGIPANEYFEDFYLPAEPSLVLPVVKIDPESLHTDFLISMGQPPHLELDKAISTGDNVHVINELGRVRSQYPQSNVTLSTAINRAIECEQLEVLKLLLKHGVKADDRNLQVAVRRGNIPLIARLVEEIQWNVNMMLSNGCTLLSLGVVHGDLVIWLLAHGADPNVQDAWAETPLSRAVELECYDVLDILLDAGADVKQGAPLHMSLRVKGETEGLRLMAKLLALGAPVDKYQGADALLWEKVGFQQGTALHSACIRGNIEAVRLLLRYGADPTRKQRVQSSEIAESSALDEATSRNRTDIVSVLQGHLQM